MRLGDFIAGGNSTATSSNSQSPTACETSRGTPTPPWTVRGTKKGGLPVKIETRRNGKVVVISNVDGDLNLLLSDVKRALGTGGVARPDEGFVEIQGNQHETTICNFLLRSGRLVGVNKGTIISAEASKKKSKPVSGENPDGKAHLNAKASPQPSSKPVVGATETEDIPDAKAIKAMKPPELKAHLAARGSSTQGNKKELIARLLALKGS